MVGREIDSWDYIDTIFVGLSKAYDCLRHDLLIAKLEPCWLDIGYWIFLVEESEFCYFGDDNTIYSCGKYLPKIKDDLIRTMQNTY